MNKAIILIVIAGLALFGGGVVYLLNQDNSEGSQTTNTQTSQSGSAPNNQTSTQAGKYVEYTSDVIANTTGTKLLFFHAPWCPQCRAIEADIKSKGVPGGVTIIKVDYDSNQALRQQYGVTIQTTLVKVDDSGKLVDKYVAYDEPNLDSIKQNLL